MHRLLVTALALVGAVAVVSGHRLQGPASPGADATFTRFFQARTPSEVTAASDAIEIGRAHV